MRDFIYYTPTKVIFGKDKHKEVGNIIKEYGFKKIMLMYGKGSVKSSGLFDEVMNSLNENGIEVVEMGGVEPNPTLIFARKAIEKARANNVEMVLAVGGGSVIDASKTTAAGVFYDGDVWDFCMNKATPKKALPTGCILTHSAAGSEMSSFAVTTNTEINIKRGFSTELNRCLFAICNPELTYTVSKYQTACGVVDILAHTLERYFVPCEDTPLTDRICEGVMSSVIESAKVLMENPCDYNARATVMWASSISHNDLTGCGRKNYLPVHQLEHALSGEYQNIAHGAGLAVLIPAWARYVYKHNLPRFAQFARGVFGVSESDDEKAALMGIECLENFFKGIEMPLRLREFDVPKECIDRLADLTTFGKTRIIETFITLDYDEIKEIFEMCW